MLSLPIPKRLKPLPAHGAVIAAVALAFGVRILLQPVLGFTSTHGCFYWAIFVSAWAGGFWPGLSATFLSALAAQYFLNAPLFSRGASQEVFATLGFVLTGTITSLFCEALRTATDSSIRSAERAKASARDAEIAREREKNILESIADGFIAFDHTGRTTFANQPAAEMLRRSRAALFGKELGSLLPNTLLSESQPKLQKAVEVQQAVHFEVYDESNGRWFGSAAYPSSDGVSLIMRDITESRKLADAVRESEERFRIMADSAPLLIWTSNGHGQRDYVNTAFLTFSGRTFEEEQGEGWADRVHPEDRARVHKTYAAANENRSAFTTEYRLQDHSGQYRWMLDSAAPRPSGHSGYSGFAGSCLDITDRRRAVESLRESEAQLRLSMRNSQMGSWHLDLRRRVFTLSPELESILGCSPGSDPKTPEFALASIHAEDRENVKRVVGPVHASGGEYEVEYRFFRTDGELRWLLVRGHAFPEPGGPCTHVSGIGIDITDRKLLEERVQHAQKLESLGVLAGGIAHDFNNLLTGILGNASLVLEELEPGSEASQMQRNIIGAGERAAQLTNQMLAYSGKGRFFVEPIDLGKLILENMRLLEASVQNKTTELKLDFPGEPCVIEGDPAQMQQVVMNLVINAAESIPEGEIGSVRVSLSVSEVGADGRELPPGQYADLRVEDTGIGMDESTASRIFDPFFTTKFTGRGLGLAAVQGIIRGHKGSIRVVSTPGDGTTFNVLLPLSPNAPLHAADKPDALAWKGRGTILVVDDEEIVRRMAALTLERFGYQVVTAENGLRAMELVRESPHRFTAILLDVMTPVMGVSETLPGLRRIRPDLKVIGCSGYSEWEIEERFVASPLDAFIQKPFTSQQLAEKVREVTGAA